MFVGANRSGSKNDAGQNSSSGDRRLVSQEPVWILPVRRLQTILPE